MVELPIVTVLPNMLFALSSFTVPVLARICVVPFTVIASLTFTDLKRMRLLNCPFFQLNAERVPSP